MFQPFLCLFATATIFFHLVSARHTSPATVPVQVIPFNAALNGMCPSEAELAEAKRLLSIDIANTFPGQTASNPASSCSALPSNSASGYYWILPPTGPPAVQMYCDFNRTCGCNGDGSTWTRLAFLNMSDPNEVCPSAWTTISSPVRACGRGVNNRNAGCDSVFYPAMGLSYSRVCGRVIGYQHYSVQAFLSLIRGHGIDNYYLDGVSLTHGSSGSRQHIWSFAAAIGENTRSISFFCDCSNPNAWPYSTSFVGNDYFCDSGNRATSWSNRIYSEDPLWDGEGCGPSSTCCEFNNPPWFCKTLPQATTDDVEVRICHKGDAEDSPVGLIEIYVQ